MQSTPPKLQICTDSPAIKRALCVAVRYEHLNPDGLELTSTHKDAHTVSKLLIDQYGYEEKDITLLLDDDDPSHDQPTQRNISRAMEDLVHGAKPGDRFVFHFSGHGSQVKNLDGSEDDGKDEVIWPLDIEIDSDRLDEDQLPMVNNYILDDDIKKILVDSLPPNAHLTIIFDCCHSGTAADLPHCHSDHWQATSPSTSPTNHRVRGHLDVSTGQASEYDGLLTPLSALSDTSPEDMSCNFPNVVSWSACKDPQLTFEHPAGGGLFIKALDHVLRHRQQPTHQELLHLVSEKIEHLAKRQNELLHARAEAGLPKIVFPRPQVATLRDYATVMESPVCL